MICKQKLRHFHALTFVDEKTPPTLTGKRRKFIDYMNKNLISFMLYSEKPPTFTGRWERYD